MWLLTLIAASAIVFPSPQLQPTYIRVIAPEGVSGGVLSVAFFKNSELRSYLVVYGMAEIVVVGLQPGKYSIVVFAEVNGKIYAGWISAALPADNLTVRVSELEDFKVVKYRVGAWAEGLEYRVVAPGIGYIATGAVSQGFIEIPSLPLIVEIGTGDSSRQLTYVPGAQPKTTVLSTESARGVVREFKEKGFFKIDLNMIIIAILTALAVAAASFIIASKAVSRGGREA